MYYDQCRPTSYPDDNNLMAQIVMGRISIQINTAYNGIKHHEGMYQPENLGKCVESEMNSWRTILRYLRYDLEGKKVNREKGQTKQYA